MLRWWKLVSAFRAFRIRRVDERVALRAFLRRSFAIAGRLVLDADHVHWTVTHDVPAVVQNEAIGLSCFG